MNNKDMPVVLGSDVTLEANHVAVLKSDITFNADDIEVLKITQEGFIYKGELIEDAGEAYKVWMEVMNLLQVWW
jgi:hypothetical protein